LCRELGILLCYEVTRDLPLEWAEIETPMTRMKAPKIAGKKLVFAPILRAGLALVEGMLDPRAGGARRAYRALPRPRKPRARSNTI
jgi:uracil phosphoribosyltransferase